MVTVNEQKGQIVLHGSFSLKQRQRTFERILAQIQDGEEQSRIIIPNYSLPYVDYNSNLKGSPDVWTLNSENRTDLEGELSEVGSDYSAVLFAEAHLHPFYLAGLLGKTIGSGKNAILFFDPAGAGMIDSRKYVSDLISQFSKGNNYSFIPGTCYECLSSESDFSMFYSGLKNFEFDNLEQLFSFDVENIAVSPIALCKECYDK
jgi:hypothetical protein